MTDHSLAEMHHGSDTDAPKTMRRRDSLLLVVILALVTVLTVAGVASAAPSADQTWRLVESTTPSDTLAARVAIGSDVQAAFGPTRTTLFEATSGSRDRGTAVGVIGVMLAAMLGLTAALWRELGRRVGAGRGRGARRW